jgi:hypothetical protein
MYKSSVSPGFGKQIMSDLLILCYNGSLGSLTVVSLTPNIFHVWLRLVLWCAQARSRDFV